MGFILLRRVGAQATDGGVNQWLLIPDLDTDALYGPLSDAVWLSNLWRLRRERPFVLASVDEDRFSQGPASTDAEYVRQLPVRQMEGAAEGRSLRYPGVGDISPFVPADEDEFLLLLPQPPPQVIPPWPAMLTQLDGVVVSRSDEFMKIRTADPSVLQLIATLPEWQASGDPHLR